MTATAPDWIRMVDAHAAQGIPTKSRTPDAVAARQAAYETASALPAIAALTFNADRTAEQHLVGLNRGRRAGSEQTARDITNSAVEDVLGPRPARHRKELQA